MSDYIVTARKWRPMRFDDVAGQTHVTATLRNAIASGRLAHAYLFSGPRGVGKTTTARLLAKALNCLAPRDNNPDNECENCREITEGRSFDVLEIDGASNRGVEEIRNLRESVRYAPARGRYKVYIIDEVHMLTKEAFNALLKTLEEPPPHVLFIFATTEVHKVPATILSRCQRFDFRRIAIDQIMANLRTIAEQEKIAIDEDALLLVARRGDGSLRDAQSLFDQVVALCGRTITLQGILQALNIVDLDVFFRVTDLILARDAGGALALVDELVRNGHDLREFVGGLVEHFRNLLVVQATGSAAQVEVSDVQRARYQEVAQRFTTPDLLRYQRFLAATEGALRWSVQPRFRVEADMVQLTLLPTAPEVGDLVARIEEWTQKGAGPAAVSPAPTGERTAPSVAPAQRPAPPPRVATTPPPPVEHTPRETPKIAIEEVRSRWEEFLALVSSKRISVGSRLSGAQPVSVSGITVHVGCVDAFQVETVQRNRDFLQTVFEEVFGARARLEADVRPGAEHPTGTTGASRTAKPSEDHPMIAAIKRELGAEPLDEGE